MIKKIKKLIYKILTRSQKFTGTDNIYIAKHGSFLTIGNIINLTASFFLAMAFARLLPKETYGSYRYIISMVAMLGIFALPGIDDAVLQAVANKFEGFFKKGLIEKLKWSTLGSLSCLIMGGYFLFLKNDFNLSISFLMASIFFPIMQSTGLYLSYLGGKKLFKIQVRYSALTQIISSLCIIITLFLTKNLIILILVYFSSYTILGLLFLMMSLKKFPANNNINNQFIGLSKNLNFLYILSTIANQIDRILLFNFLGGVQVAVYSFAILPTSEAYIFLKNIRSLALPKFSTSPREEIRKTLLKKVYKATLLMVPLIVLFFVVAPYIYKIFFPQYLDSVDIARLFFVSIIFFPASLISLYFQSQLMKKELYQSNIISSIVTILLLIILTPLLGIIGPILARLIGQFFSVVLSIIVFKKS